MSIGFYYPTYAAPTAQWVSGRGPALPVVERVDYPEQLAGTTAGGILYVQKKGARRTTYELRFIELSAADKSAALGFYETVFKAAHVFHYRDPGGALHSVRWMNEFQLQLDSGGRYSGVIHLREE
jgi:hypothetical protein